MIHRSIRISSTHFYSNNYIFTLSAVNFERNESGNWIVRTSEGDIVAEHLVIANSFWSREFVHNLHLHLPLPVYAIEHHVLITDCVVDELQSLQFELPTLRDPYIPANIRQEGDGLLVGIYESKSKPWAVEGIPEDFAEDLLEPNIERLEPHLRKLLERIPVLNNVDLRKIINGPICYTPDGCPLLGPCEDYPGLWLATGFCIGIGTGGGSGDYLAKWIVNGVPEYELPLVYPSRFSATLTELECLDLIQNTYASGYTLQKS